MNLQEVISIPTSPQVSGEGASVLAGVWCQGLAGRLDISSGKCCLVNVVLERLPQFWLVFGVRAWQDV